MADKKQSVWSVLSKIDCSKHTEKKNGLTYLSWAWAWSILKENFPEATSTIYEDKDGNNYFTDGRTCWVKTGVTVDGIEHIEELPVMDFKNKSIPLNNVTSYEVNKTIQRSLTKAIARHGLGMYIYAGEDLPSEEDGKQEVKPAVKQEQKAKAAPKADVRQAAIQCWKMWQSNHQEQSSDEVKQGFNDAVFRITGKASKECGASDWDNVAKEFAQPF